MIKNMKILTSHEVKRLQLDQISIITADIFEGYDVIGDRAFCGCSSLTSITIPNSVTSIGNWAFGYCSLLTSVTIPNSVTSIGGAAFAYCKSLTSITIGNSVTSIGERAFWNCTSLTSVTIPNSVTSIGGGAFYQCSSLTSVTIPNSVTSIGFCAFYQCSSLTSVTIPNSVTSIGGGAFYQCSSLTSVIIGDKTYEGQEIIDGKCKAYKGFKSDLTCRGYQYKEGEIFIMEKPIEMCKQGFYACLNLKDVLNYYNGEIGKDFVIHEVELENVQTKSDYNFINTDSKVVANKITIGKRIL